MDVKKYFGPRQSLIDYIIEKTMKSNSNRKSRKYSAEFQKILDKSGLKIPKEVFENEKLTKLVCKVGCDDSFNYCTEFRLILLKKLILPKEAFLHKKFCRLQCKVVVSRMSSEFIKMKCIPLQIID